VDRQQRAQDDLGRRLADLRRTRGWTQAKTAEHAGMGYKEYQALELGTRDLKLSTMLRLADVFELSVRALFERPSSRAKRRPGRPRSPGSRHTEKRRTR
jgi:transcriptional regulator with XRE-family HTH domain